MEFSITESVSEETDPRFVNIIWEGELTLPYGRPAGQEILATYSYDENQTMHASFVDVATGKETKTSLSTISSHKKKFSFSKIDKFLLE